MAQHMQKSSEIDTRNHTIESGVHWYISLVVLIQTSKKYLHWMSMMFSRY
jgi:hypothetical protein